MEQQRVALANGIELDVVDEGPRDAPVLIFLHGFGLLLILSSRSREEMLVRRIRPLPPLRLRTYRMQFQQLRSRGGVCCGVSHCRHSEGRPDMPQRWTRSGRG